MADFLENLDFLLKNNDMRRADLARAINIPQSTINSWYARGSEKVNITILKDIAAYFNVSLEELINGKPYTSITALTFTHSEYTNHELLLIENFAKMLKESRDKDDK